MGWIYNVGLIKMKQLILFPEFHKEAEYTLYIMGNGFDLCHGIKSSYNDFYKWLVRKGQTRLVQLMDVFFNNKDDLWNDIENALGNYDEEKILDFCTPCIIDYDHPMRYAYQVEDSPDSIFEPIIDNFIMLYQQWVEDIDICLAKQQFFLSKRSFYLTFNYTNLLELIYHIPVNNILHIHGDRLYNKNYVIGHCNYRDPINAWAEDELLFNCRAYEKIVNRMNNLVKSQSTIIGQYLPFFSSLSQINRVIVVGHSLNNIDMPYFNKIKNSIKDNAKWNISWHTQNDYHKIHSFAKLMSLTNFTSFEL